MSGEEVQSAALLAMLVAADSSAYTPTTLAAYRDEHSGNLPTTYTELHVMERFVPSPYVGGQIGARFYRVRLVQVAKLYVNAQRERDRATTALEGSYLSAGGRDSTLISRALSDDPIQPADDGWFYGTSEFTYGI